MSFVVRQISRTSDGREIIRPSNFDETSITVGRDGGSNIQLPDLAVDLTHARINRDGGRVTIESVSGLAFDVDGRSTKSASIDSSKGGEVRFGGHLLTISNDGGNVVINVQRVDALSDASEEREEIGLFTLKGLLPGRRPLAWGLIAATLAFFLIWPIYTFATTSGVKQREAGFHGDNSWSSGPLSDAHKSLANNCQACHVNKFESVRDESCMTCHKADAHDHADMTKLAMAREAPGIGGKIKGFFKASFGKTEGGCVDCHTEHEGAGPMAPTAQAFCTDCHATLDTRVTDTKLANAGDFGTGHPQFMPTITASIEGDKRLTHRVSFDARPTENNGLKFTHAQHMSSTNAVGRMAQTMKAEQGWGDKLDCADCHQTTPDGTRFKPVSMEQSCQMCHSLAFDQIGGTMRTLRHGEPGQVAADIRAFYRGTSPVRPLNLGGLARRRPGNYAMNETAQEYVTGVRAWPGQAEGAVRAVFEGKGACAECHVVLPVASNGAPYSIQKVFQPDRYMMKGWFDHNAHRQETCVSCHSANTSNDAKDLLLPDLASCRTCHVGGTGDRLKPVKTPVVSTCAMCHDYHIDGNAPWRTEQQVNKEKGIPRLTRTGVPAAPLAPASGLR